MIERLHMTTLSDTELMLMDALWDGDCAFWMLQADEYADVTDLPYSHKLSETELTETLATLTARHLIRAYLYVYAESDDRRYFGLSQKGGAYWELERKPDWDTYCYPSELDGMWSVESQSLATAQAYAQWAYDAGWGAPSHQKLDVIEKVTYRFLPWIDFPLIYELRGELQPKTYALDWEEYQERRTWWTDLSEWLDL